jgi:hypothetical protein
MSFCTVAAAGDKEATSKSGKSQTGHRREPAVIIGSSIRGSLFERKRTCTKRSAGLSSLQAIHEGYAVAVKYGLAPIKERDLRSNI